MPPAPLNYGHDVRGAWASRNFEESTHTAVPELHQGSRSVLLCRPHFPVADIRPLRSAAANNTTIHQVRDVMQACVWNDDGMVEAVRGGPVIVPRIRAIYVAFLHLRHGTPLYVTRIERGRERSRRPRIPSGEAGKEGLAPKQR